MKVKDFIVCNKNLYKSTYEGNAFTEGSSYTINKIDKYENQIYLIDNEGNKFNFSLIREFPFYFIEDYFSIKK